MNRPVEGLALADGRDILGTIAVGRKYGLIIIMMVLATLRNLKRRLTDLNARLLAPESSCCLHSLRRFVLLELSWLIQHYRRDLQVAHFDAGLALLEPVGSVDVLLLLRSCVRVAIVRSKIASYIQVIRILVVHCPHVLGVG